jgi:hypothetical protein
MTLRQWSESRWVVAHDASAEEIADLLAVVDRELEDASLKGLSDDGRMSHSYNAGLQLATVALAAEGYRPGRERAHERVIESLRFTAVPDRKLIDALDLARRKRNVGNYDRSGGTSKREANDIYKAVTRLRDHVLAWLRKKHPELLAE